jgi:hypothetical protein
LSLAQFVFATLTVLAPPEAAATGGMQFDADLPAHERSALRESFERVLPLACKPPPCVGGDCTEDQPSVALSIAGATRDYTLHWVANAPHLDAPLIVESRCELCSLVEVEEQLAADLGSLCARLAASADTPGRVRVSAQPRRAWVRLDGHRIGHTPWAGEVAVGEHQLKVGARGHGTQARTLQVFAGIEQREHFELMALSHKRRPAWPGWSSLGIGIALGIAGTALIAIDGQDWRGRCSGSNVDANGNCRFAYSTLPFGIALASLGAVSIASGVGLIVWAQQGDQGATLSWRGSF